MTVLSGKRVLVVEDEALVAAMVEDILADLGAVLVATATNIDRATELAQSETIDVAVLDVNVRGRRVDPVADILRQRGIPFVFATGYGATMSTASRDVVIDKPYTPAKLAEALARALGLPAGA